MAARREISSVRLPDRPENAHLRARQQLWAASASMQERSRASIHGSTSNSLRSAAADPLFYVNGIRVTDMLKKAQENSETDDGQREIGEAVERGRSRRRHLTAHQDHGAQRRISFSVGKRRSHRSISLKHCMRVKSKSSVIRTVVHREENKANIAENAATRVEDTKVQSLQSGRRRVAGIVRSPREKPPSPPLIRRIKGNLLENQHLWKDKREAGERMGGKGRGHSSNLFWRTNHDTTEARQRSGSKSLTNLIHREFKSALHGQDSYVNAGTHEMVMTTGVNSFGRDLSFAAEKTRLQQSGSDIGSKRRAREFFFVNGESGCLFPYDNVNGNTSHWALGDDIKLAESREAYRGPHRISKKFSKSQVDDKNVGSRLSGKDNIIDFDRGNGDEIQKTGAQKTAHSQAAYGRLATLFQKTSHAPSRNLKMVRGETHKICPDSILSKKDENKFLSTCIIPHVSGLRRTCSTGWAMRLGNLEGAECVSALSQVTPNLRKSNDFETVHGVGRFSGSLEAMQRRRSKSEVFLEKTSLLELDQTRKESSSAHLQKMSVFATPVVRHPESRRAHSVRKYTSQQRGRSLIATPPAFPQKAQPRRVKEMRGHQIFPTASRHRISQFLAESPVSTSKSASPRSRHWERSALESSVVQVDVLESSTPDSTSSFEYLYCSGEARLQSPPANDNGEDAKSAQSEHVSGEGARDLGRRGVGRIRTHLPRQRSEVVSERIKGSDWLADVNEKVKQSHTQLHMQDNSARTANSGRICLEVTDPMGLSRIQKKTIAIEKSKTFFSLVGRAAGEFIFGGSRRSKSEIPSTPSTKRYALPTKAVDRKLQTTRHARARYRRMYDCVPDVPAECFFARALLDALFQAQERMVAEQAEATQLTHQKMKRLLDRQQLLIRQQQRMAEASVTGWIRERERQERAQMIEEDFDAPKSYWESQRELLSVFVEFVAMQERLEGASIVPMLDDWVTEQQQAAVSSKHVLIKKSHADISRTESSLRKEEESSPVEGSFELVCKREDVAASLKLEKSSLNNASNLSSNESTDVTASSSAFLSLKAHRNLLRDVRRTLATVLQPLTSTRSPLSVTSALKNKHQLQPQLRGYTSSIPALVGDNVETMWDDDEEEENNAMKGQKSAHQRAGKVEIAGCDKLQEAEKIEELDVQKSTSIHGREHHRDSSAVGPLMEGQIDDTKLFGNCVSRDKDNIFDKIFFDWSFHQYTTAKQEDQISTACGANPVNVSYSIRNRKEEAKNRLHRKNSIVQRHDEPHEEYAHKGDGAKSARVDEPMSETVQQGDSCFSTYPESLTEDVCVNTIRMIEADKVKQTGESEREQDACDRTTGAADGQKIDTYDTKDDAKNIYTESPLAASVLQLYKGDPWNTGISSAKGGMGQSQELNDAFEEEASRGAEKVLAQLLRQQRILLKNKDQNSWEMASLLVNIEKICYAEAPQTESDFINALEHNCGSSMLKSSCYVKEASRSIVTNTPSLDRERRFATTSRPFHPFAGDYIYHRHREADTEGTDEQQPERALEESLKLRRDGHCALWKNGGDCTLLRQVEPQWSYSIATSLYPLILLQDSNFRFFKMRFDEQKKMQRTKSLFSMIKKILTTLPSASKNKQDEWSSNFSHLYFPFPKQALRLPRRFFFSERPAAEVILITSSLGVRKRTYFNCMRLSNFLACKSIIYYVIDSNVDSPDKPDVRLLRRWKRQRILRNAPHMHQRGVLIPQILVDGQSIGSYDEVMKLEDDGILDALLARGRCPTCLQPRSRNKTECISCSNAFRELLSIRRQDEGQLVEMYRGRTTSASPILSQHFDEHTSWSIYYGFCSACGSAKRPEEPFCPRCHLTTRDIALAKILGLGIYRYSICPTCGHDVGTARDCLKQISFEEAPLFSTPPSSGYLTSDATPLCSQCQTLLTFFQPISSTHCASLECAPVIQRQKPPFRLEEEVKASD